jgi:hypothetical protein
MKKYWVIVKAFGVVAILLVIKMAIDQLSLDVIVPNAVISALVTGVIFTMAAIFSGILSDFKESEKIPGELAATIRSLYKEIRVATITHKDLTPDMVNHIIQLLKAMNTNFRRNQWVRRQINPAIDRLDEDIEHLAAEGIAPAFITRIRGEMSAVEKLSYRIDTIMETKFLPSAYIIAIIATSAVTITLLFTKMDPYYEALGLFSSIAFVLISMLLLIHDMDNPFEVGTSSSAEVDLNVLFRLEKQLENQPDINLPA